jgi:GDPmannose 4,6-dehydratase
MGVIVKTAFITGVTGQDGAYLAQFLLGKNYRVVGMRRRSACASDERLRWLGVSERVELVDGDLTDLSSLIRLVSDHRPDEVYNLAAQSFVAASWGQPLVTGQVTGMGAVNLLEAVRIAHPRARFYQASSSEMFGASDLPAQSEATPFHPRSPYAAAKLYAHAMTVNYRESYGLYACAGILFNHESPLRGVEFVTRHITDGVARIKMGLATELKLGNLEARRDWGHARDYVRAMWLMLQRERPEDFVIATGVSASVREFCELAFAQAGLRAANHLRIDPAKFRPAEVDALRGDARRAARELGWRPAVSLASLVAEMVDSDLARYGHAA